MALHANRNMKSKASKFKVGEWVEVCSKEEILNTLDGAGCFDAMPFMPEMFAFCGKRFQVYKRAHKTCDTVFPVRGRRVAKAVHLETRCDGSAHGGCQAGCLLFWKEEWLQRLGESSDGSNSAPQRSLKRALPRSGAAGCTEQNVWMATLKAANCAEPVYVCQATQLPYATTELNWWDIRQYIEDYRSGNVTLWRILCGVCYFFYYAISKAGIGLGRPMRWLYDRLYPVWRGAPFPRRRGTIQPGQPTPTETLDLQPGELVRIKPYKEILSTLNTQNRNRGLYFDAEEVPYCGGTYRVLKRVTKIIHEKTGKLLEMKTPCIVLDSVTCDSRYSECRLFCPRGIYSYWREIWLERVSPQCTSNFAADEQDKRCKRLSTNGRQRVEI